MGIRGPLPAPAAVKKKAGTYRPDRDTAGTAPVGEPPMPAELDATARRIWTEIVPQLLALGTLAPTDGGTLAAYCALMSHALRLSQEVAKDVGRQFSAGLSPAGIEMRKLWPVVSVLGRELGLNFAGRCRNR